MRNEVDRAAMIRLFEGIRAAFQGLSMQLDHNPPTVDINMDIPEQPGLAFAMNLNLQGDELHLSVGSFWLEWFPCTRPDVVQAYQEAVHGLISGTYRIRERHRVGSPFIVGELQIPNQGGWQTIGTSGGWASPFQGSVERILQNVLPSSSGT